MKGPLCNFPKVDAQKRTQICGAQATTTRAVSPSVIIDACADCAALFDEQRAPREVPALDLDILREVLIHLRVAWDDAQFVADDLLRPLRLRGMGHLMHLEKFNEARSTLDYSLTFAMRMLGVTPPEPPQEGGEDGGGDNGGDGPVH